MNLIIVKGLCAVACANCKKAQLGVMPRAAAAVGSPSSGAS